jgi:hypothetical protein
MSKLLKLGLILCVIVSFSSGLTYLAVTLFSSVHNPGYSLMLSFTSFMVSYVINQDIIEEEEKQRESETF